MIVYGGDYQSVWITAYKPHGELALEFSLYGIAITKKAFGFESMV